MEALLGSTPPHVPWSDSKSETFRFFNTTINSLLVHVMGSTEMLGGIKNHSKLSMPSDIMRYITDYDGPTAIFRKKEEWAEIKSGLLG